MRLGNHVNLHDQIEDIHEEIILKRNVKMDSYEQALDVKQYHVFLEATEASGGLILKFGGIKLKIKIISVNQNCFLFIMSRGWKNMPGREKK